MRIMSSNIHRALVFQGGGSPGAYEAGAYKAINEDITGYFRTEGRENEPVFHIVSGTSIGAISAALLVSYVKENKTWPPLLGFSSSCCNGAGSSWVPAS